MMGSLGSHVSDRRGRDSMALAAETLRRVAAQRAGVAVLSGLLMASTSMAAAPRDTTVDLAMVRGGVVVLYGNVLRDSVYSLQAWVTIAGADTIWHRLLLNGYALDFPERPAPSVESDSARARLHASSRDERDLRERVQASRQRFVEDREANGQRASPREIARFLAAEYAKDTALVSGIEAGHDGEPVVVWRRTGMREHIVLSPHLTSWPPTEQLLRLHARAIAGHIRSRQVLLISRGAEFTPGDPALCLEEIRRLQNGLDPEESRLPDKRFAREVAHPSVSLDALRIAGREPR